MMMGMFFNHPAAGDVHDYFPPESHNFERQFAIESDEFALESGQFDLDSGQFDLDTSQFKSDQGVKYRTQAWKRTTSDPSRLMPN